MKVPSTKNNFFFPLPLRGLLFLFLKLLLIYIYILVMLLCCFFVATIHNQLERFYQAEASLIHLTDDHLLSEQQIPKITTFTVNKEHNWINKIVNYTKRTVRFQNKIWL